MCVFKMLQDEQKKDSIAKKIAHAKNAYVVLYVTPPGSTLELCDKCTRWTNSASLEQPNLDQMHALAGEKNIASS